MKRGSRARRVLKWGGIGVGLILFLAAIVSRWYAFSAACGVDALLAQGNLYVHYVPGGSFGVNLAVRASWPGYVWMLPDVREEALMVGGLGGAVVPAGAVIWTVVIPLWLPFVVFALPTASLWCRDWWRGSRRAPGHCRKCGYDLTGNISGRCPECGAAIEGVLRGTGGVR